jgi:hypothetical protein
VCIDGGERVAQWRRCRELVGGKQGSEQPLLELAVEDRDALALGGQDVGVAGVESLDEAVQAEPAEVVAHLVAGVGLAEQLAHLGTQAPVGEADDGVQGQAQGTEQGHDPRVAEPQGRGPPAFGGDRGQRDPLKGWARKDTRTPDMVSWIMQAWGGL